MLTPPLLTPHPAAQRPGLALPRRAVLLAAGGVALGPVGAAMAAPAVAAPALRLAPLSIHSRTLANGLQSVFVRAAGSATAAVQMWYRVGGKDDPAGRSGFAHLFEHMMFKRTRHMPNEMFDRLTEDVGGSNNAYTSEDVTVYQNDIPVNHVERLLWAEAERLAHLNVDQANLDSERAVVQEEYRERVLADPYGRLFNALPEQAFARHPYRRPVIGNLDDLAAATLDDVRQFHATYYRPDNAVLVVAGDLDAAQLDAWVDRYLAGVPRPALPLPRVAVREPQRQADRRAALRAPKVPLPAIALLWQGPPAAHDDRYALSIAQALLAGGESSRLNEQLVYHAQAAQTAGFACELYADAGMLVAYAIAATGRKLEELEALLMKEIHRLASQPIAAAELDKVRARLLTGALLGRQTPAGKAAAVGQALLVRGDARAADLELPALQAVTAADVQRVLRRWVLGGKRVSVTYSAEAS